MLTLGWNHFNEGRYAEAEQACRQALQADAGDADAWHLLAMAQCRTGRFGEAEDSFLRAIAARPDLAGAHSNLGIILAMQGRPEEALARFRRALDLDPNLADAHNNLGCALRDLGRADQAEPSFARAVELDPDHAMALRSLVVLLDGRGAFAELAGILRRVLGHRPHHLEARLRLGGALLSLGEIEESAASYREALRLAPDCAEAQHGLGAALGRLGRYKEAPACLKPQPDQAAAYNNLGCTLQARGQFEEALDAHARALELRPDDADFHTNRGAALDLLGRYDEALACHEQALRLAPDHAHAHHNRGVVLEALGKYAEALDGFERAIRLEPDLAEAHKHRAMIWLKLGDFARGWPEYEWRWKCRAFDKLRSPVLLWGGEPLDGRTILLHAEQGLGDTLQFVRYAPLVKARGGRVLVEFPRPVVRLLETCPGIDRVIPRGDPLPPFDVHAPLMSLPALLGTTPETIPATVPYLTADPARVRRWRDALAPIGGLRVGIAWRGGPLHRRDRHRSFPLSLYEKLAGIEGVRLISLQRGPGAEQLAALGGRFPVVGLGEGVDPGLASMEDTPAVMMGLDLVIAPDTALAHLAGALGVPVWIALPFSADFRWLVGREDSPWYPTARLFRQARLDDWEGVFERMAGALAVTCAARRHRQPIHVEVSPGELIDRITIRQIQRDRMIDAATLEAVLAELAALEVARDRAIEPSAELAGLAGELREVHLARSRAGDELRACEGAGDFGPRFIELARSINRLEDRRATIRARIDETLGGNRFRPAPESSKRLIESREEVSSRCVNAGSDPL
jgi:tetratricopeptide (TPR) repeat protein